MYRTALVFAVTLVATTALGTDIDKKQLVGSWTGEMSFKVGDETHKVPVKMTFAADGKLTTSSGEVKEQTSTWRIERDTVILTDPESRGNDIKLTDVKLGAGRLDARMLPVKVDDGSKEVQIKLEMKRAP